MAARGHAFEFRVGGEWEFVMHGPDGTDYEDLITWTEIAPPERIALLHGGFRGDPNAFTSLITFAAEGAAAVMECAGVARAMEAKEQSDVIRKLVMQREPLPVGSK